MATKDKIRRAFTSPPGIAVYPRLNVPDYKYDKAGKYTCKLRFTPGEEGVDDFIAQLQAWEEEAYSLQLAQEGKKRTLKRHDLCVRADVDDEGEETGDWLVQAGMKAHIEPEGRAGWDQRPQLFDSKRNAIDPENSDHIGGGSKCRMKFDADGFYHGGKFGMSLRLGSVQVIDLVVYTPSGGSDGFEEEDGYTYEAPEAATKSESKDGDY